MAPLRPDRVVAWTSRCRPRGGSSGSISGVLGLGRHEDAVCPVEDPPLGVRFEDVDAHRFLISNLSVNSEM